MTHIPLYFIFKYVIVGFRKTAKMNPIVIAKMKGINSQ